MAEVAIRMTVDEIIERALEATGEPVKFEAVVHNGPGIYLVFETDTGRDKALVVMEDRTIFIVTMAYHIETNIEEQRKTKVIRTEGPVPDEITLA